MATKTTGRFCHQRRWRTTHSKDAAADDSRSVIRYSRPSRESTSITTVSSFTPNSHPDHDRQLGSCWNERRFVDVQRQAVLRHLGSIQSALRSAKPAPTYILRILRACVRGRSRIERRRIPRIRLRRFETKLSRSCCQPACPSPTRSSERNAKIDVLAETWIRSPCNNGIIDLDRRGTGRLPGDGRGGHERERS